MHTHTVFRLWRRAPVATLAFVGVGSLVPILFESDRPWWAIVGLVTTIMLTLAAAQKSQRMEVEKGLELLRGWAVSTYSKAN